MNILLFIPDKDPAVGGIFQYITCLIEMLGKSNDNNSYYLFLRNNAEYFIKYNEKFNNIICIPESHTKTTSALFTLSDKIKKSINYFLKKIKFNVSITTPSVLDKIIEHYKIDIVHFPYIRYEKVKVPTITTIHDVQELYFPEYFSSKERAIRSSLNHNCITNSDAIVVSYNHIKEDIIKFFNQQPDKITVLLLSMQNLWFEKFLKEPIDIIEHKKNYLLYPAATWQHKNHLNLLKTINYLYKEKQVKINLICTGNTTEYYEKTLKPYIAENQLEDLISFTGIVSDKSLYSLYMNATGVVVPTKYEAGSFPLMESILLRVPVICSNVTSLPETIGNNQYTFNPDDIEEIANKTEQLFFSEEFRKNCLINTEKQIDRLIFTDAYKKLIIRYSELIRNHQKKTNT